MGRQDGDVLLGTLSFIRTVQRDTDALLGRVQSETLKYLYLLFSDDSVLPFDSKRLLI